MKANIEQVSAAAPGSKEYISKYQEGLRRAWESLGDGDKKEMEDLATEWTASSPPDIVKQK